MTAFDYIIVGAGSAGCVLADKLTASGVHSVLLLEAGGDDAGLMISMPKGIARLLVDPRRTWRLPTEPEPATGNRAETWLRGRLLGGSSSVNAMLWGRGQPHDWDALEVAAGPGWGWRGMLPQLRGLEDHVLGADEWRGAGGPVRVSLPPPGDPLSEAMIDAGVKLGLRRREDLNGPQAQGTVGYLPATIRDGRRWSAARAFLERARSRPKFAVMAGVTVERVVFEGTRAAGVVGADGREFRSGREVILAAGGLASPAILQRSGIGPPDTLGALGIPVIRACPGVGANLREHRLAILQYRMSGPGSHNRLYFGLPFLWQALRYLLTRKGVMASAPYPVGAFVRSNPALDRPDGQLLLAPVSFDLANFPTALEKTPGISCIGQLLRPESQGSVMIRSARASDAPTIRPNYLAAESDRRAMTGLLRVMRELFRQPPLAALLGEETCPGAAAQSDADILAAIAQQGGCGFHAVGTCAMGRDASSPLDERLRVRGVAGLRVIDGSAFPFMISGTPNAPIMGLASRGAELVLAEAQ